MSMSLITLIILLSDWLSTRVCVMICLGILITAILDGCWVFLHYNKWGILYQVQTFEDSRTLFFVEVVSLGIHQLFNLLIGLQLYIISRLFLVTP